MISDSARICLTGATGLLGSALLPKLLAHNPAIKIRAVYHTNPPQVNDPRIEWVQADLLRRQECDRVVQGCDTLVMAAVVTGGSAMLINTPHAQVNDNLIMNAHLLEAAAGHNLNQCVVAGSASVYQAGDGTFAESDLDLNLDPAPQYLGVGMAFRAVENLIRFWHTRCQTRFTVFRIANMFGPADHFDPQRAHVIPALIRRSCEGGALEVWGEPGFTRDVIFAPDVADAVIGALSAPAGLETTFNIGAGTPRTLATIAQAIQSATGNTATVIFNSEKAVRVPQRTLDCRLASQVLNWQPQTPFDQAIRATVTWWLENKTRWRP